MPRAACLVECDIINTILWQLYNWSCEMLQHVCSHFLYGTIGLRNCLFLQDRWPLPSIFTVYLLKSSHSTTLPIQSQRPGFLPWQFCTATVSPRFRGRSFLVCSSSSPPLLTCRLARATSLCWSILCHSGFSLSSQLSIKACPNTWLLKTLTSVQLQPIIAELCLVMVTYSLSNHSPQYNSIKLFSVPSTE